jgi:excinuclease ABC subunit C
MSFDAKILDQYPSDPGVYLMKDQLGKVLYVGKAKNLKKRIKSYFTEGRDNRPMIPLLVVQVHKVDFLVAFTEKEALLLENTLIKRHQPKYNALLKDDKTYVSLMINHTHAWPMLRLVRYKGKPKGAGLYFGPYTSAYAARQIYELLTRLFPLRQCSDAELARRTRPCLLYSIKRCIAPCVNLCSKQEYQTFVEGAIQFLKGQNKEILQHFYTEMEKASENLEFEKAAAFLNTIRQIEHVTKDTQIVAKSAGKNCDALALYRQGDEVMLMQLFFREGNLIGSEHYSFKNILEENEEILSSFILQHYRDAKDLPQEILLPSALKEAAVLEEILQEMRHKKIALVFPQKGDKRHLVELAEKNAEAAFNQEKNHQEMKEKTLLDLAETLKLNRYPERIECFDTSNIGGTELVASMIAFTDGVRDKKRTRLFRIRDIDKSDDYGAMRQVLSRRLIRAKEEDDLPDLIIVDGGKGQLNIALEIFKELDIASVDVIGLAKEEGRHDKGLTQEKVFIPHQKDPIILGHTSPLLFLLQKIRDEAHRSAIEFQKKRRGAKSLGSALDSIPGIGPVKRKMLLRHFGSMKRLLEATEAELSEIKGLTKKDIEALRKKAQ